jgi:hypothetical protein
MDPAGVSPLSAIATSKPVAKSRSAPTSDQDVVVPSKRSHPDSPEAGDGNRGPSRDSTDNVTRTQVENFMQMTAFMEQDDLLSLTMSACIGRKFKLGDAEVLNQHRGFKDRLLLAWEEKSVEKVISLSKGAAPI